MKLRGISNDRKPVYFDIKDVPVLLNDSTVVLTKRFNSPQIIAKSIMRGTDDNLLFESDFVMSITDRRLVGFVVYDDGFYIWDTMNDTLIPLRSVKDYVFVPNTQMYRLTDISGYRSRIRFKCGKRSFDIKRIIYSKGDELFITIMPSGSPIYISDTNFGTGIYVKNIEVGYGQYVKYGTVVLHDYHPMLKLFDGTYKELEEEDYEELGITECSHS